MVAILSGAGEIDNKQKDWVSHSLLGRAGAMGDTEQVRGMAEAGCEGAQGQPLREGKPGNSRAIRGRMGAGMA